jgi:hypothetical protein
MNSIVLDEKNEISTNPPRNVPTMLPADDSAENLPTMPPDEATLRIASLVIKGDTMPIKRLGAAKRTADAATEAI